jgi:hypothetical protein
MLVTHTKNLIHLTESIISHDTLDHAKTITHAAWQGAKHGLNPLNLLADKYDNIMKPGKQHTQLKQHLKVDNLDKTKKGALEAYQAGETGVLTGEAYITDKVLNKTSEKYPTQTKIARDILDKADDIL